jgi:outer membrane biosynthesis protein TonB
MRLPLAALVAFAVPLACGGGTPQPKDPDEGSPAKAASNPQGASDEAVHDSPSPAAPSSASAPSPAAPAAPPTAETKAAPADDVWMAPHQMPAADVLKTMRPVKGKVQACYRAGVKRDPSTSGEVKVRFVITHEGQVRAWRDDASSMNDEEVTKCVGELVKSLTFPKQKSPGDAWGTYSINFSP